LPRARWLCKGPSPEARAQQGGRLMPTELPHIVQSFSWPWVKPVVTAPGAHPRSPFTMFRERSRFPGGPARINPLLRASPGTADRGRWTCSPGWLRRHDLAGQIAHHDQPPRQASSTSRRDCLQGIAQRHAVRPGCVLDRVLEVHRCCRGHSARPREGKQQRAARTRGQRDQ
jgi:hypothetical protein